MDGMMQAGNEVVDIPSVFAALESGLVPGEGNPARSTTIAGQVVRLVAAMGAGGWHKHDTMTETIIVWSGSFDVEYHDRIVRLSAGQCTVIEAGVEHRGVSETGAQIISLRKAEA